MEDDLFILETQAWPHIVGKHTLSPGKGMLHAFHYPIIFQPPGLRTAPYLVLWTQGSGGKQAGP